MLIVHRKWPTCILEEGNESKLLRFCVLPSSGYCRTERERERKKGRENRRSVRSSAIDMDWGIYRRDVFEISQRYLLQTTLCNMNSTWMCLVERRTFAARHWTVRRPTLCCIYIYIYIYIRPFELCVSNWRPCRDLHVTLPRCVHIRIKMLVQYSFLHDTITLPRNLVSAYW